MTCRHPINAARRVSTADSCWRGEAQLLERNYCSDTETEEPSDDVADVDYVHQCPVDQRTLGYVRCDMNSTMSIYVGRYACIYIG